MSAARWSLGLAASALLHGAGLAALALTTRPDPVPDQDVPRSRFAVEAAEVARSRATPETSQGTPAPEADAASAPARQGAVPQSQASATTPSAQNIAASDTAAPAISASSQTGASVAATVPRPDALAPVAGPAVQRPTRAQGTTLATLSPAIGTASPARPPSASLSAAPATTAALPARAPRVASYRAATPVAASLQAAAPVADAVAPVRPSAAMLAATPDRTTPLALAAPPADVIVALDAGDATRPAAMATAAAPLLAVTPPRSDIVETALPEQARPAPVAPPAPAAATARTDGTVAIALPAPAETAATTAPDSTPAAARPLPAEQGRAELAFSGAGDVAVSAASLAAIAAFTREGDLDAAAAQVRDGIEGLLAAVPCARLQTEFDPETGAIALRGHIPEDALRAPVLAALQAQLGEAITVTDSLLILPRPQCGALAGIAEAGLPQSTDQLDNPAVIGADGFARTYGFAAGERLDFDLTAPDYDAYLYFDYFTADGSVLHLVPNETVPLVPSPAKSTLSVGRADGDRPFLELTVAPPFGQEIAAVFAASTPLYDGLRPLQEPAAPYLAFLKERIAQARAENPDFKGEWVYYFITTRAE